MSPKDQKTYNIHFNCKIVDGENMLFQFTRQNKLYIIFQTNWLEHDHLYYCSSIYQSNRLFIDLGGLCIVYNKQLATKMHDECLSFTLTSFITAGWISEKQLQTVIEGFSHKDQTMASITALELLHLNHQQYFLPESFEINLGKVLQIIAPLANFSPPLSFLASGDLFGFQAYC